MPAEHDDGPDPLMAVLTGEGLPDEAVTDPSLLAAYQAAEADVTLLRTHLKHLGNTLADAPPSTLSPADEDRTRPRHAPDGHRTPPRGAGNCATSHDAPADEDRTRPGHAPDGHRPPPRGAGNCATGHDAPADEDRARPGHAPDGHRPPPRGAGNCATSHDAPADKNGTRPRARRRHPVALAGLVTAVAVSAALGLARLAAAPGGETADGASSKADTGAGAARESAAGYLACARLVVEGTVTAVAPGRQAGQRRVTLHVTRSYKPVTAPADITFTWEDFLDPRPAKGDHALVGIPRNADVPDIWVVDPREMAQERDWLAGGLSGATAAACP
ncbi:hypothetical protein ACFWII_02790 [Streptomyces sp. NPDC127063]|uniref:hypothetical protein n=1 Tax=Streptomyces sp. NPDC127063 TaxID=3347123 RepID=UPI00365CE8DE